MFSTSIYIILTCSQVSEGAVSQTMSCVQVFAGIFPMDQSEFPGLKSALDKLLLNDSSVDVNVDSRSVTVSSGVQGSKFVKLTVGQAGGHVEANVHFSVQQLTCLINK